MSPSETKRHRSFFGPARPGRTLVAALLSVLAAAHGATGATAPALTRGPYLQSGTPTNMLVRWRTSQATDSRVRFGLTAEAFNWELASASLTTEHIIALTNLSPNTRYFYAVGSSATNWAGGADCNFSTAPLAGKPTRIWVVGDSGTQLQPGWAGASASVRDAYEAYAGGRDTDVWLMLGDDAYLNGNDAQFQAELFDIYPAMLRRVPLWSCIGNHDVDPADGFPYLQVFSFPTNGEAGGVPSGTNTYYAFDYGNIHFVCLDSETSDRHTNGPMLTWLRQDLAANQKDWLIAFWHSPPYSKGSHDSDTYDIDNRMIDMRQNALPILEAHGVDLVLCGHSHDYERSYLLDGHYGYSFTLVPSMVRDSGDGRPDGTGAYLKAGLGPQPHQGAVFAVAGSSGWLTPVGLLNHPAMFTSIYGLGSLVLDVETNRLDAVFVRETGAIFDHFSIVKGAAPGPLKVAAFVPAPASLRLQWKSVAGRTYQVQKSAGLETQNWQDASPVLTAFGATTAWTNASPPNLPRAFYRVVAR